MVVGQDVRPTSPALTAALVRGLTEGGADVLDIGLCGTEEVYFATSHAGADGGIMVTASHNPVDYNGMKLVREGAGRSAATRGLDEIRALAEAGRFDRRRAAGRRDALRRTGPAYVDHLLGYVDASTPCGR